MFAATGIFNVTNLLSDKPALRTSVGRLPIVRTREADCESEGRAWLPQSVDICTFRVPAGHDYRAICIKVSGSRNPN
jgi:hypothetical protein